MLLKILIISWRNVWRNRLRSLIVIIAIAIGIWAGLFLLAFSYGMNNQRVGDTIKKQTSHVQIHQQDYSKDFDVSKYIEYSDTLANILSEHPNMVEMTTRVLVNGMIASANNNAGVMIKGIDVNKEKLITGLDSWIIEGSYFNEGDKNKILIGEKLAEKLKIRLKSKPVVTFQNLNREVTVGKFKVVGIFKTNNSMYDEANVFVRNEDLHRLFGKSINKNTYHEIAILLSNKDSSEAYAKNINMQLPEKYRAQSWKELAPEIAYSNDLMDQMMNIFMSIIMLALAFGILNTMLMVVLERTKELGVLMAIGMNKTKVFTMIMIETLILCMLGGPLGILFSAISINLLKDHGIDLSMFSEGLASFGASNIVYPEINTVFYFNVLLMVVTTAILSSIYPSIRALKLNPVEALRKL